MIWLTWRQSRMESLLGATVLFCVGVFLLWTGNSMIDWYHDAGLPACAASQGGDQVCRETLSAFANKFDRLSNLVEWLNLLPFVVGLLLAAPVVLDFEQGTYRLAWTQSMTRRHWLLSKIGYGLAVSVIVSALLVAVMTWWHGPFDAIDGRLNGNGFDFEGTVPFAYTIFAFSLCLAIGTLLRRTVPAMAVGIAVYLVARIGVMSELRPRYLDPLKLTWDPSEPEPAGAGPFGGGNWIVRQGLEIAQGASGTVGDALRACTGGVAKSNEVRVVSPGSREVVNSCLHDHGVLHAIYYHPADRFWTFQAIETALFLGVAAALLGITYWWVMRRVV